MTALERFDFGSDNCSIKRTLDLVGEKWTLLVLREAFYGVRRFEDFHRGVECARNMLSARLATLVAEGILARAPYCDPGSRRRHEYRLTDKGRELLPVVIALLQWGDKWQADPEGPAVIVRHRGCNAEVGVVVQCAAGHGPLAARDTYPSAGPGARRVA